MVIASKQFDEISKLIYKVSGIVLNSSKNSLLAARIGKRLRALQIDSVQDYIDHLNSKNGEQEYIHLIDVVSTNYTFFFREEVHFTVLENALKQLKNNGLRKLRIWSCASSTGEEPYSLALLLNKVMGPNFDQRILATDISLSVLETCKQGIYPKDKIKTIPKYLTTNNFLQSDGNPNFLEVAPHIKKLISFQWLNLNNPPFPMKGPFDFVFCRNVMIYFDDAVRQKLIDEVYRLLAPGGLLMIGHSESLNSLQHNFKSLAPSIYQKGF